MTADVTFVSDSVSDVLYVSDQAIVYDGSDAYVYQLVNGEYTLVPVEVGFTNGSEIEITSGLEEGDTIYIASKISSSTNVEDLKDTSTDSSGSTDSESSESTNTESGGMPSGGDMPSGGGGMPSGGPGGN